MKPVFTQEEEQFIKCGEMFYLGQVSPMSDEEWDSKRRPFEKKYGSVFKYMEFGTAKVKIPHPLYSMFGLGKIIIKGDFHAQMLPVVNRAIEDQKYIMPKYDGCSVVAYYEEGNLIRIATKSKEDVGIDKTIDLWRKFPKKVAPIIKYIRAEALVDLRHGFGVYGCRAKANGLVTSETMQEQVDKYISLRAFVCYCEDWTVEKNINLLKNLPSLVNTENKEWTEYEFAPATFLDETNIVKDQKVITPEGEFVADGIVIYSPLSNTIQGYKIHCSDVQVTTIRKIEYNKSPKGNAIPKILYDVVYYNAEYDDEGNRVGGIRNDKCSPNGIQELINQRLGVGAVIAVGLSGTTIPQVIEVIEGSDDFQIPVCECGQQYEIVGGTLKCNNPLCSKRQEQTEARIKARLGEFDDDYENWIDEDPANFLQTCLNIDRVNLVKKLEGADWGDMMDACYNLVNGDTDKVFTFLQKHVSFTALAKQIYDLNSQLVSKIL